MLTRFIFGGALLGLSVTPVFAQSSVQIELANMREDMRGLVQKVGELGLRIEQLERENSSLQSKAAAADESYATVAQLNSSVAALNDSIRAANAATKSETLQQVGIQMEKLARQTNAAIDSLAKGAATRPVVQQTFSDNYAKEGASYTIQKGDTLAVIARKTGASVQDIINANKISDPSKIQVGQTIFIPGAK